MQRHINLVLPRRVRNLVDARISLFLCRQTLHLLAPLRLLLLPQALDSSFGSGILRCGVWRCGAEVEGFVEDFIDEDGSSEGGGVGLAEEIMRDVVGVCHGDHATCCLPVLLRV